MLQTGLKMSVVPMPPPRFIKACVLSMDIAPAQNDNISADADRRSSQRAQQYVLIIAMQALLAVVVNGKDGEKAHHFRSHTHCRALQMPDMFCLCSGNWGRRLGCPCKCMGTRLSRGQLRPKQHTGVTIMLSQYTVADVHRTGKV